VFSRDSKYACYTVFLKTQLYSTLSLQCACSFNRVLQTAGELQPEPVPDEGSPRNHRGKNRVDSGSIRSNRQRVQRPVREFPRPLCGGWDGLQTKLITQAVNRKTAQTGEFYQRLGAAGRQVFYSVRAGDQFGVFEISQVFLFAQVNQVSVTRLEVFW
jgi:hypothetical protein